MQRAKAPVWVTAVLAILALLIMGSGNTIAFADPSPAEASPEFLPTPPTDPFYFPDPGFEDLANGTVLKSREIPEAIPGIAIPGVVVPHHATQLLVRSNDSKDRPIAAVTTVLVPTSAWTGLDPRPLVSEQLPINSLGADCNPSVKLTNGRALGIDLPPALQELLGKGYAVSIPDHLGPRNAYAAGRVAGHVVNDTALAALTLPDSGLTSDSPVAFTGYSGGAIATGWAVGLAPVYAPMLNVVGATVGGTPSDFSLLPETMDHGLPIGLLASAALGLIREYPELEPLVNMDLVGPILPFFKDQCQDVNIAAGLPVGLLGLGLQDFSTAIGNLYDDPLVQEVMEENRMGQLMPTAPVLAVHGDDEWIPLSGAEDLKAEMCDKGVNWQLAKFPGEHIIAGGTSLPKVISWLYDRLDGVPVGDGCTL